ncbi:MAG: hypothetical protein FJ299_01505 [Planctomycetes bacterium]|nr:hypothetical protein [Planctomycetota bacterium]
MNSVIRALSCITLSLGIAGCSAPVLADGTQSPAAKLLPFGGASTTEAPKLYGRDGCVVSAALPGSVGAANQQKVVPGGGDGTRTQIIELNQQAVEQRDRMRGELADYAAALQQAQARIEQLEADLRSSSGSMSMSTLERDRLLQENLDLAGRLATAQIRRLEAEKALLEHLAAQAEQAATQPGSSTNAGTQAVVQVEGRR